MIFKSIQWFIKRNFFAKPNYNYSKNLMIKKIKIKFNIKNNKPICYFEESTRRSRREKREE